MHMPPAHRTPHTTNIRRLSASLAVVVCAAAIIGCGSSHHDDGTGASGGPLLSTRNAYGRTECRTSLTRARPADSPSRMTSTPSLPRSSRPNKPATASPETAAVAGHRRAASSSCSRSQDACARTESRTSPTHDHTRHRAAATSSEATAPTLGSEPHKSGNHRRTNGLPGPAS